MDMKYLFLLLAFAFFIAACENDGYQYTGQDVIELEKDPCFGTCPVYQFKIDGKGNATFLGEKNVGKEGNWKRVFPPAETNELFQAFEQGDFWGFEDEYTAQVTDLPTTWVTFRMAGKEKKIKDYYGAPPALKELEKKAELLAESEEGWQKTGSE